MARPLRSAEVRPTMSGIAKFRETAAARSAPGPRSNVPSTGAPHPIVARPGDLAWGEEIPSDTRGEHRFVPLRTATTLTTSSGQQVPARIMNISRTGVALEADFSVVEPREIVKAGSRPVTPGRVIARGAVFLFVRPLDKRLCNQNLVL